MLSTQIMKDHDSERRHLNWKERNHDLWRAMFMKDRARSKSVKS